MRVRDILHGRTLYWVEESQTVSEVARHMAERHVGAIVVLHGGQLRGVFSERDLMTRVVLNSLNPSTTAVREVMTPGSSLATVDESATLEEAMESMQAHNCRHLPVTHGSQVCGFLSMRDLMNVELDRKTEELHHMRAYIHGQ